jgi:hypothetical protein
VDGLAFLRDRTDGLRQALRLEWQREVVERALADRGDRLVDRGVGAGRDHRQPAAFAVEQPEQPRDPARDRIFEGDDEAVARGVGGELGRVRIDFGVVPQRNRTAGDLRAAAVVIVEHVDGEAARHAGACAVWGR